MPNEELRKKIGSMLEDATNDPSGISYHDNFVIIKGCYFNKELNLGSILHGVMLGSIYFDNRTFSELVLMDETVSGNELPKFDSEIKFHACKFDADVEFNGMLFTKSISTRWRN